MHGTGNSFNCIAMKLSSTLKIHAGFTIIMEVVLPLHAPDTGMCPGLGEWWLYKGVLNLRIPCGHFGLCEVASKTSIFIHI